MGAMKNDGLYYLAASVLCVAWLLIPGETHAAKNYNLNINSDGNVEHCSDLRVRSNGEVAQTSETVSLQKSEAPILEIDDTAGHGVIHVRGGDRANYTVETCKIATAGDRSAAEALLRSISITHSAGRFSSSGPASSDGNGNWQLYYIVHAPKDANLDLQTRNGPIDVADIAGSVKVRAVNGPISLNNLTGQVEANTTNGPISLNGGGGDVHLTAHNGPISLNLSGEVWNGSRLEARTVNGPVSINLPEAFRTGIRVETDGHAPVSCAIDPCRNAWTDASSNQRILQLNGAQDTIRVSTSNGPVSVGGQKKGRRVI
jgi:hypothetical protein